MGRSALATMALVVWCRIVLADSVVDVDVVRGFPSPMTSVTTLSLSVGRAAIFQPTVPSARQPVHLDVEEEPLVEPADTSLGDLTTSAMPTGLDPGLFDDGNAMVLGGGALESIDPNLVRTDGGAGAKFDWPDLSGIVEALVSQSSRELVAKYRLPGHECHDDARRKRKKSKEELMALAKCRRKPHSPFSKSFHVIAAAFIGTFLVIIVLRRSGKGSYWW